MIQPLRRMNPGIGGQKWYERCGDGGFFQTADSMPQESQFWRDYLPLYTQLGASEAYPSNYFRQNPVNASVVG